jgi:hypothetical protein
VKNKVTEYKQPDCAINLRNRETKKQEEKPSSETRGANAEAARRGGAGGAEAGQAPRSAVTVEDYRAGAPPAFRTAAARLMAFPGRLAPQLVEVPTPAIAQGVIDGAVRELLKEMQQDADRADEAAVA